MIFTKSELKELFETLPLPVRYQVFDAKPPLPFALWRFIESNDMYADDVNYMKIRVLELTIVSDKSEDEIEAAAEELLKDHGLTYSVRFTYLNDDRLFETTYTTEVILENG